MVVILDKGELSRLQGTVAAQKLEELRTAGVGRLAAAALRAGQTRRALTLAQGALILDAEDGAALRVAGLACLQLGDTTHARQAFERAVLEDPHDWVSAVELAGLHAAAGDVATARGYLALLSSDADVPAEALRAIAEKVAAAQ